MPSDARDTTEELINMNDRAHKRALVDGSARLLAALTTHHGRIVDRLRQQAAARRQP